MPSDAPNKPAIDYPFQPVPANRLLTERSSSWIGTFDPVEPGTPFNPLNHSVQENQQFGSSIFLGQRMGKDDEWQERVWADKPTLQDLYNYDQHYVAEADAYPIFERAYLELRDEYPALRRTRLQPLTGLYAVRVTASGSGYDPKNPPVVTCNNGATAIAIVDPTTGGIAKITLTAEGANCTTSVTIAAPPVGGVQATAVGVLQPATCLLAKEDAVRAPAPWDSLYLLVTRLYMTLPGPEVWTPGFNSELGAPTSEYRQLVAMPDTLPTMGTTKVSPGGLNQALYDGDIPPFNGNANVGIKITKYISDPPSRTESQSIGYQFPAQFLFIGPWAVPPPFGLTTPGPYAGVNYTLTAHKTLSTVADVDITYSNGPPSMVGIVIFNVVTPGRADRFFGIQDNTIHNAIHIVESNGLGSQVVEDLPASTPSSYTPGSTLVIRASARKILGNLWEKQVISCLAI